MTPVAAQTLPPASDGGKLEQVQHLIDILKADLGEKTLSPTERVATLEKLKVFGRDANQSDPIFTKEGIETLSRHGFDRASDESTREALRCIANALLVAPDTRQTFVDLGYAGKAVDKFQTDSPDDEFLLGRILFLITYGTAADLSKLFKEHSLPKHLNSAITRHAKGYSKIRETKTPSVVQDMALSETLKLLFNITHLNLGKADLFSNSVPNIFKILCRRQLPSPPLQPPVTHLINALLCLDSPPTSGSVFPPFDPTCNIARLIEILDLSTDNRHVGHDNDRDQLFDEAGAPLLTLLRRMYEISPEHAKAFMHKRLLPSEEERNNPLGRGDSLAARLLQLSTSAMTPNTREHLASLLFEVSNSNPEEFVRNVGYGYASGLLLSRGIQLPQSALENLSVSPDGSGKPVNPITGQTLDSEPEIKDPFGDMTDEEKEREAERLFVLFERLKNTGVVDIKNPVEQALHEGRFEELD